MKRLIIIILSLTACIAACAYNAATPAVTAINTHKAALEAL